MRFLAGVLAAQPFLSVLSGDKSLRSRPMGRIVKPLKAMGVEIWGRGDGSLAPLAIRGASLQGIEYTLPVASAQVKSALLLAGLYAQGETVLHQPAVSRDHTERMLGSMGTNLAEKGLTLTVGPGELQSVDIDVPADFSSAACWLVTGVCHPRAEIRLPGVGINPGRGGLLEALSMMGADISIEDRREQGSEPISDLVARTSSLKGAEIGGDLIPSMVDEIPLLALAACFAEGTTVICDASELRVKESDRIRATVQGLSRLGAEIEERPDGMVIQGTGRLVGAACRSYGDHRLAMALGVAGLLAEGETKIQGAEAAAVTYPGFWNDLQGLAVGGGGN
jgi:3-phosphoshikimate 1-carboxyvinyltransferase